ncbi:uncharacterized protein LOC110372164 [Helicoverpa armigera]|uniref:uncharacterized protein LOC110372164 n=1 Tax=Helicoverpa armigera TaxID=29058 RepID=UPI003083B57C
MYSKMPFSLENIPRQRSFGCLSLKFGCIFSGLLIILYTVLALAQCLASLDKQIPGSVNMDNLENVMMYSFAIGVIVGHIITLILTTIMMVGALREKAYLIKPWVVWTSCIVMANMLLIVFCTVLVMIPSHTDSSELLMYFVISFLGLIIRIYMLMLVTSYYMDLEEEKIERLRTLLNTDTWHSTA